MTQIPNLFTLIAYVTNAATRILNVLNEEEIVEYRDLTHSLGSVDDVIVLEGASFAWLKEDIDPAPLTKNDKSHVQISQHEESDKEFHVNGGKEETENSGLNRGLYTVSNVSLNISRGSLVGIVGSVGSGKSSLLSGILGEMYLTSGKVKVVGSLSYHQQQPWILNMSLKDNILFGLPYDKVKFNNVIEAAALFPDIQNLSAGIETEIGEKGITLSGGQKAR